jgi:hypothetical protein
MLNILRGEEHICLDSDPTKGVENNVTAILKKTVGLEKSTRLNFTPKWSTPPPPHVWSRQSA